MSLTDYIKKAAIGVAMTGALAGSADAQTTPKTRAEFGIVSSRDAMVYFEDYTFNKGMTVRQALNKMGLTEVKNKAEFLELIKKVDLIEQDLKEMTDKTHCFMANYAYSQGNLVNSSIGAIYSADTLSTGADNDPDIVNMNFKYTDWDPKGHSKGDKLEVNACIKGMCGGLEANINNSCRLDENYVLPNRTFTLVNSEHLKDIDWNAQWYISEWISQNGVYDQKRDESVLKVKRLRDGAEDFCTLRFFDHNKNGVDAGDSAVQHCEGKGLENTQKNIVLEGTREKINPQGSVNNYIILNGKNAYVPTPPKTKVELEKYLTYELMRPDNACTMAMFAMDKGVIDDEVPGEYNSSFYEMGIWVASKELNGMRYAISFFDNTGTVELLGPGISDKLHVSAEYNGLSADVNFAFQEDCKVMDYPGEINRKYKLINTPHLASNLSDAGVKMEDFLCAKWNNANLVFKNGKYDARKSEYLLQLRIKNSTSLNRNQLGESLCTYTLHDPNKNGVDAGDILSESCFSKLTKKRLKSSYVFEGSSRITCDSSDDGSNIIEIIN